MLEVRGLRQEMIKGKGFLPPTSRPELVEGRSSNLHLFTLCSMLFSTTSPFRLPLSQIPDRSHRATNENNYQYKYFSMLNGYECYGMHCLLEEACSRYFLVCEQGYALEHLVLGSNYYFPYDLTTFYGSK